MRLTTPLSKVLKTTKEYIEALDAMGLHTVEDLLLYLPRAHEDLSTMCTLKTAALDTKVTMSGTIDKLKLVKTRSRKQLVTAKFIDSDGDICDVIWFNQPHIKRMLNDGDAVVLTGKLVESGYKLQLQSPLFEKEIRGELVHSGRLVPIYPQHEQITTKWLREKIILVKEAIARIPETLPKEVLDEEQFLSRADCISAMHFPESADDIEKAKNRLAYEQLYGMQVKALTLKQEWQGDRQERLKIPMDVQLIRDFFASLQFTPTDSQRVAIYEILKDMENDKPMSRLLEGDVGSGKTLVATAVIANVLKSSGGQCALMVPTEVLAKQHAQSIGKTLIGFYNYCASKGINMPCPQVALLTGSTPKVQGEQIRDRIAAGGFDVVIGTHALIEEKVQFKNLMLVIVDEQHRFGVAQRTRLKEKGSPHFLSMTATPIPRTLALTAHGHHDLSVLLEKPGNRKPIDTKVVSPNDRKTVELFIDHQINEGRQVFVICPLISESSNEDMLEMKNVETERRRLEESFSHRRIASLHGRMTPPEKERIMREFKDKQYDILVSTSVIEVGIDVPNATIIIIEGAERFGLAQLHQFRGRVGRSDHKSHCFLFTTNPEQAKSPRLRSMEKYDSGFQLAEIDLQLRGPGELFGLRQSGIPEFVQNSLMNPELVVRARQAAERFLKMA